MHSDKVLTKNHIQQRLTNIVAFKGDRAGAKLAIEREIKTLCDADIIRQIPHATMVQKYGKYPTAYAVSDPEAILKRGKI